ncbi:hypothetical protein RRG08_005840 [Elysia crispata]|uniref:Uncharacterized protein n=1 Tax=Elysia crispata TaxID=231223 RepID=A0AAE1AJL9_9GAST|nr:hypothetical protein RRG08_005840 [Elysia crispata]
MVNVTAIIFRVLCVYSPVRLKSKAFQSVNRRTGNSERNTSLQHFTLVGKTCKQHTQPEQGRRGHWTLYEHCHLWEKSLDQLKNAGAKKVLCNVKGKQER